MRAGLILATSSSLATLILAAAIKTAASVDPSTIGLDAEKPLERRGLSKLSCFGGCLPSHTSQQSSGASHNVQAPGSEPKRLSSQPLQPATTDDHEFKYIPKGEVMVKYDGHGQEKVFYHRDRQNPNAGTSNLGPQVLDSEKSKAVLQKIKDLAQMSNVKGGARVTFGKNGDQKVDYNLKVEGGASASTSSSAANIDAARKEPPIMTDAQINRLFRAIDRTPANNQAGSSRNKHKSSN